MKVIFYEMETDEVDRLMRQHYLSEWVYDEDHLDDSVAELRVASPFHEGWTLDRCLSELQPSLRFGDVGQIKALEALEFYALLYNWGYPNKDGLAEKGISFD